MAKVFDYFKPRTEPSGVAKTKASRAELEELRDAFVRDTAPETEGSLSAADAERMAHIAWRAKTHGIEDTPTARAEPVKAADAAAEDAAALAAAGEDLRKAIEASTVIPPEMKAKANEIANNALNMNRTRGGSVDLSAPIEAAKNIATAVSDTAIAAGRVGAKAAHTVEKWVGSRQHQATRHEELSPLVARGHELRRERERTVSQGERKAQPFFALPDDSVARIAAVHQVTRQPLSALTDKPVQVEIDGKIRTVTLTKAERDAAAALLEGQREGAMSMLKSLVWRASAAPDETTLEHLAIMKKLTHIVEHGYIPMQRESAGDMFQASVSRARAREIIDANKMSSDPLTQSIVKAAERQLDAGEERVTLWARTEEQASLQKAAEADMERVAKKLGLAPREYARIAEAQRDDRRMLRPGKPGDILSAARIQGEDQAAIERVLGSMQFFRAHRQLRPAVRCAGRGHERQGDRAAREGRDAVVFDLRRAASRGA